jgi:putative PIN family toxin of toxin-antitoxin system
MRVVIDTNVFVSSFYGGKPRQVVELWFKGEIKLCLSKPIILEYVDVLRRFEFRDEKLLLRLLALFEKGYHTFFVSSPEEDNWVPVDPADNKFIACAVTTKADFIISGDAHLLKKSSWQGIGVVTPSKFLDSWKEAG